MMNSLMMDALWNTFQMVYFKDLKSRCIRVNRVCAEKSYRFKSPEEAIGKLILTFSKEHAAQAYRDEQNIIKQASPHKY